MQNTVSVERYKYIGGSDIPIIMGISPFKSRFRLLQEKAQIVEDDFQGNKYTDYGNILEPQIRAYINDYSDSYFVEGKHYKGDYRIHTDGEDEMTETILEVKTTSQIHEKVGDYKVYLVQLLFYLDVLGWERGILAVYERPENMDIKFNSLLLTTYEINIKDYEELIEDIHYEVDRFKEDLTRLKENPFLEERDFFPEDIQSLANKLVEFKRREEQIKVVWEAERSVLESKLVERLREQGLKKCTGFDGWSFSITKNGNISARHKESQNDL